MLRKIALIGLPLMLVAGVSLADAPPLAISVTPVGKHDAELQNLLPLTYNVDVKDQSGRPLSSGTTLPQGQVTSWIVTPKKQQVLGKANADSGSLVCDPSKSCVLLDFTNANSNSPYDCTVTATYDGPNNDWVIDKKHNHCPDVNSGVIKGDSPQLAFRVTEE